MEMVEATMSLAVTINLPHVFGSRPPPPQERPRILEAETLALMVVVSFLLAHHMTRLALEAPGSRGS